jgi:hypothetical protein
LSKKEGNERHARKAGRKNKLYRDFMGTLAFHGSEVRSYGEFKQNSNMTYPDFSRITVKCVYRIMCRKIRMKHKVQLRNLSV